MRRSLVLSTLLLCSLSSAAALAAPPALAPRAHFLDVGRFNAATALDPQSLELAARAVVSERIASRLELSGARHLRTGRGERVVRLAQHHQGLPVAQRGAAVTFGVDGVARLVGADLEDDLPADVTPAFDAAEAARKASSFSPLPLGADRARLAIWPSPEGGRLAYVVSGIPVMALPVAPVIVIDAKTGELVLRANAATSLHQAKMYDTNPTKSPTLETVTLPVKDGETHLTSDDIVARNCIDTKKSKDISVQGFNLTVHTCELQQTAVADANGDYLIDPPAQDTAPEDSFAEVSMFHHTSRILARFRKFAPTLEVQAGAITAVANLRVPDGFSSFDTTKMADPNLPLVPFQNAFFAPEDPIFSQVFTISGGAMWFGQGPKRDYGYDGDVVYHEFTHAVVNATIQLVGTPHRDKYGISVSPGAMNEGLADFFSSALAGDPDVGEYASGDITSGAKAIRSLAQTDACPSAIGGEVHQDATLFSGALWDVRAALDPKDHDAFDQGIYTAMAGAPSGDLGYEDLATLFVAGTKAALGQAASDKLTAAFTTRGVLPGCQRILELGSTPLQGPKELQSVWFSLGTGTTGVNSKNFNPGVVQFHHKLGDGTTRITLRFQGQSQGGGFGGGGAYTPSVAVRYGQPITFALKPFALEEAASVTIVAATSSKGVYEASFDVPAGATEVYAMIGNKGQSDGLFTSVRIEESNEPVAAGAGGASGAAGAGGAGGDAGTAGAGDSGASGSGATGGTTDAGGTSAGGSGGNGPAVEGTTSDDDSGCGCRTAPARPGASAAGLLGLVALGALRRRRSRG